MPSTNHNAFSGPDSFWMRHHWHWWHFGPQVLFFLSQCFLFHSLSLALCQLFSIDGPLLLLCIVIHSGVFFSIFKGRFFFFKAEPRIGACPTLPGDPRSESHIFCRWCSSVHFVRMWPTWLLGFLRVPVARQEPSPQKQWKIECLRFKAACVCVCVQTYNSLQLLHR